MRRRVLSFDRKKSATTPTPVQVPPVQITHADFQADRQSDPTIHALLPPTASPASGQLPPILPTTDIKLGRHIGTGSFKYVYEAKVPHLGNVAALRFRQQSNRTAIGWPREAAALTMLADSPYITKLLAASKDPDHHGWMLLMDMAKLEC